MGVFGKKILMLIFLVQQAGIWELAKICSFWLLVVFSARWRLRVDNALLSKYVCIKVYIAAYLRFPLFNF